jgi:hypothetical protein
MLNDVEAATYFSTSPLIDLQSYWKKMGAEMSITMLGIFPSLECIGADNKKMQGHQVSNQISQG